VFYFADAPTLAQNLFTFRRPVAYTTIAILTLTTFVFGGFAREQVCIYMCPWPRIQAAMMDEDTITVAYRDWRGEPRRARQGQGRENLGDCIDCNACVNVCPMGIDIRDGQQLACITCALCIDACDDMMDKIGKPRGLIDYMALTDETRERAGKQPRAIWKHIFRPRTILYTSLWSLVGVGLLVALFIRSDIDVTVAPVRNPTFVTLSDGSIRNTYDVRLLNMHGETGRSASRSRATSRCACELEGTPYQTVTVPANETKLQRVYVVAPAARRRRCGNLTDVRFWVTDNCQWRTRAYKDSTFNGTGVE
jgi:cytochrome c oxidase accessory protein FixG